MDSGKFPFSSVRILSSYVEEVRSMVYHAVGRFCRCVLVMSSSLLGSPRPPFGLNTEEASASGQCGPAAAAGTAASAALLLILLGSLGILAREAPVNSHSETVTTSMQKRRET